MQELTMNEINSVSGAGLFGFFGQTLAMCAGGYLGAAAATKYLSTTAIPYISELIPEEYRIATYVAAGFVAGAAAMYGGVHQSGGHAPHYF